MFRIVNYKYFIRIDLSVLDSSGYMKSKMLFLGMLMQCRGSIWSNWNTCCQA